MTKPVAFNYQEYVCLNEECHRLREEVANLQIRCRIAEAANEEEFENAFRRMCANYPDCTGCPLEGIGCEPSTWLDRDDSMIPIVDKWAKEHPAEDQIDEILSSRSEKPNTSDLISRADALEIIDKLMEIHFDRKVVLAKVYDQIKDMPSADLPFDEEAYEKGYTAGQFAEQKTGKWIDDDKHNHKYHRCSVCGIGRFNWGNDNFCPNCGARMVG